MRVVITLTVFDMVLNSKYFYVRYKGILEALNMYASSALNVSLELDMNKGQGHHHEFYLGKIKSSTDQE